MGCNNIKCVCTFLCLLNVTIFENTKSWLISKIGFIEKCVQILGFFSVVVTSFYHEFADLNTLQESLENDKQRLHWHRELRAARRLVEAVFGQQLLFCDPRCRGALARNGRRRVRCVFHYHWLPLISKAEEIFVTPTSTRLQIISEKEMKELGFSFINLLLLLLALVWFPSVLAVDCINLLSAILFISKGYKYGGKFSSKCFALLQWRKLAVHGEPGELSAPHYQPPRGICRWWLQSAEEHRGENVSHLRHLPLHFTGSATFSLPL